MKVSRFEGLDCWHQARELTRSIYRLTANGKFSRDYGLRDQMRRASVSIMANITEGFSRKGDREFSQFLFVAKSSAAEIQSHAYVALDQQYISEPEFKSAYDMAEQESKMLSNFIKYLSRPTRGRSLPTTQ
ncbi:MAG: four helix bundle protein [Desulfomonile tiedjei]|nr:four helix bundle protein [Desulfomonile tiedjei]